MSNEEPTVYKYPWEEIFFVADFSKLAEVIDGAALGTPSAVIISADPISSTLAVDSAVINTLDASDGHGGTIPANEGVEARITGGATGDTAILEYRTILTPPGNAKRARRFNLVVL